MPRVPDPLARLALVAVLACACTSPARIEADPPADAAKPKTLVIAVGNLGQIDPAHMLTPQDERMVLACFEGLTTLDWTTGKAKPAAAESWSTSPDGKTWTFKLRPVKWTKQFGKGVEVKDEVSAADFVAAWNRLLDPDTQSPNAHILDGIPDAKVLAGESVRGASLDKLANEISARIGKNARTLKGDEVIAFLTDEGLEARRFMASIADPAVLEFLAWKDENTPYQGVKAQKLIAVLRAESKKSVLATTEARAHLGIDRGYYAKDDKTLVIEVPGPSPWLPALLARGPLVALRASWYEMKRENYFLRNQVFCNGPFLADCDLIRHMSGDEERNLYKLVYHKNPSYWNAAAVTVDHVTCHVNEVLDEVLRKYAAGEIHWLSSTAFHPEDFARLLATKAPGFQPRTKEKDKEGARRDEAFAKIAPDTFEAAGGGICFVRVRCTPPFDSADARRGLASLLKSDVLVKSWLQGLAPPTRRFVQPRIAGAAATIRLPSFDAANARKLYGDKKRLDGDWISVACETEESAVADAMVKAWKTGGIPDEATTWVGLAQDVRRRISMGTWNLSISCWQPAYDDPFALLGGFTTGNPVGATMWSNATYDALLKAAVDVAGFLSAPDPVLKSLPALKGPMASASAASLPSLEALRQALLSEAESILLEEAVVIPLWTTVDRGLAKPCVHGLPKGGGARSVLDVTPLQSITLD